MNIIESISTCLIKSRIGNHHEQKHEGRDVLHVEAHEEVGLTGIEKKRRRTKWAGVGARGTGGVEAAFGDLERQIIPTREYAQVR